MLGRLHHPVEVREMDDAGHVGLREFHTAGEFELERHYFRRAGVFDKLRLVIKNTSIISAASSSSEKTTSARPAGESWA
jgi:hypothetical protein